MTFPKESLQITVVIATRNRRPQLEGCLASLLLQKGAAGRFDLVVVNDGSTDDTESCLAAFAESAPFPVTVVNQLNTGVATARNRGISLASGAIVDFTDDDCLLPEEWIASQLELWQGAGDEVAGIGGPLDTDCREGKIVAEYLEYLDEFNHIPVVTPLVIRPRHVATLSGAESIAYLRTSNSSFRADALRSIGGFDGRFCRPGGEDPDLCYRLLFAGYSLTLCRELKVRHLSRPDLRAYFGSLKNYVRGEFINRSNRDRYPAGAIRRSYSVIPLQKLAALFLSVILSPLAALKVARRRGRVDSRALLFPALLIASKAVAVKVALGEIRTRSGGKGEA